MKDFEGALLIVVPNKVEKGIPSNTGEPFDAVDCATYVCDGPHAGHEDPGLWFIGKALQNQLEPLVGKNEGPILGRLVIPAGKRYRILVDPTDEDIALAERMFPQFADQPVEPAAGKLRPKLDDTYPKPTPKAAEPLPEEPPF
jgi:hypothetical protein